MTNHDKAALRARFSELERRERSEGLTNAERKALYQTPIEPMETGKGTAVHVFIGLGFAGLIMLALWVIA